MLVAAHLHDNAQTRGAMLDEEQACRSPPGPSPLAASG